MAVMRCPVCKAENSQGPACRRCKADLSLLFLLEEQARALAEAGRLLASGRADEADARAEEADWLRSDDESRRLRAATRLMRATSRGRGQRGAGWRESAEGRKIKGRPRFEGIMSPNLVSVLAAAESLPVAERRGAGRSAPRGIGRCAAGAGPGAADPERSLAPGDRPTVGGIRRRPGGYRGLARGARRAGSRGGLQVASIRLLHGPKRTWRRRPPGIKPRVPRRLAALKRQ